MGTLTMSLYLKQLRERFSAATRKEKGKILDEFCATTNYHRKSAIRLFNKPASSYLKRRPAGKPKTYEPERLLEPLKRIWIATDQLCSKRLKSALPLWLPFYEKHYEALEISIATQLKSMSPATIDRLLKPIRGHLRHGLSGTKPGSLLKNQIPIKTNQWDEERPGFVEADTVAHCGDSLNGSFVWSLTLTDIASGWTENRAIWNKGADGVLDRVKCIETHLPFELLGFDCDNGSEFLNHHLVRYFTERPEHEKVQFTRSRPYKKNDNAHVEQKNWTHVRQLFGYHRFDNPRIMPLMNDLYQNELSLLQNYFYPCIKLLSKTRVKSKIVKKHSKPMTPYQRLLNSKHVSKSQKDNLKQVFESLDPFELKRRIEKKLHRIFQYVNVADTKQRKRI